MNPVLVASLGVGFMTMVGGLVGATLVYRASMANRETTAAANAATAAANKATNDTANRRLDLEYMQQTLLAMGERIDDLEDHVKHERHQRQLSNAYSRTLAQVIRDLGGTVPQPPDGLDLP